MILRNHHYCKSVTLPVELLTAESENAIKWLSDYKVIVKSIFSKKPIKQSNHFLLGSDIVEIVWSISIDEFTREFT